MKAIVHDRYGPPEAVLELRDVDPPVLADNQVLVRVRAASVNPLDWVHTTGTPYVVRLGGGWSRPRQNVRGVDAAGEVVAVGPDVTGLRPGDEVFGMCAGAFAEYLSARADRLVRKPANLTFEQAATVPVAALTALQALRDHGRLQSGQRVLINGASGGVGTFAVQIAKALGAEVTAVCGPRNVDAVRALGADQVMDYTTDDFVHSGQRFHLIVDVAGNRSLADRRQALVPEGTLVLVGGPKTNRWIGPMGSFVTLSLAARFDRRRMMAMLAKSSQPDLTTLRDLLEGGTVTPVVERTYPLSEVPQALAYLGQGHARAKIAITVAAPEG